MTHALKDQIGIFVVLLLLHDSVDRTPLGLTMLAELCLVMCVLAGSLARSLKHQTIWLSQTLRKLNRQIVRPLLPSLIIGHSVMYIFYAVYRSASLRTCLHCNLFAILVIFCCIEEYGFYNRSMRLILLWTFALSYVLNYCNKTTDQTTMTEFMKMPIIKTLLIIGTFATFIVRSTRITLYLYQFRMGQRKPGHPNVI